MRKNRIDDERERIFDETDIAIIRVLQGDGRASDTAIAKSVGVSNDTARRRRERLERMGVLRVRALVDPRKLGYIHFLHMAVATRPSVSTRAYARRMSKDPGVYYTALTLGPQQQVLVHYRSKTERGLYDFLERVRADPQVADVVANVVFEVVKVSYHSPDLRGE